MSQFISGLKISKQFYEELVVPILEQNFSGLVYSAALIGPGSEVLGFDTERSVDHDWRPRVFVFLSSEDFQNQGEQVEQILREKLTQKFLGYPTSIEINNDIRSRFVYSVQNFAQEYLGLDDKGEKMENVDWLTFHEHCLLAFTSGEIFHNGLKELTNLRAQLAYYPNDVWLYLMASEWKKISQEQPFIGRTGDVGDDIGSRLITARIIQSIMRFCFYSEKTYIPYSKWFGTAFNNLGCATMLKPLIEKVFVADNWKERESALAPIFETVVGLHNKLGITKPVDTKMNNFRDRPYLVIGADEIVAKLQEAIRDERLKTLPLIGSINQISESVDFADEVKLREKAKQLYR